MALILERNGENFNASGQMGRNAGTQKKRAPRYVILRMRDVQYQTDWQKRDGLCVIPFSGMFAD